MKKLPLVVAIAAVSMSASMSSHAVFYTKTYSTQVATPLPTATPKPISTVASATTNTYYTGPTSGASSTAYPAIQVVNANGGSWTFNFTNLNAVTFTGALNYGNYETQTNVTGLATIQGHIQGNITHNFSGTGVYNDVTNTFTYTKAIGASNSSVGSTATGSYTCKNGATSGLGQVCNSVAATTLSWEGLILNFQFDENRNNFTGKITGTERGGSGLTSATTTILWNVTEAHVPVPAAAWMFGSALVGLAGVKRRRKS